MTDSAVQTSELEYTVTAIINRQSMSCTMHMILDEYDIAYTICGVMCVLVVTSLTKENPSSFLHVQVLIKTLVCIHLH